MPPNTQEIQKELGRIRKQALDIGQTAADQRLIDPSILDVPTGPTPSPTTAVTPTIEADQLGVVSPLQIPQTPQETTTSLFNEFAELLQQDTEVEQPEFTPIQRRIASLEGQLAGEEGFRVRQEEKLGVPDLNQDLVQLQQDIRNKTASLRAGLVDQEGRPVTMARLQGREAQLKRQAAAEIDALSAASEAVQGNILLAQSAVDRAVSRKFEPLRARVEQARSILEFNKENMTRAEKKQAEKRENELSLLQLRLERSETQERDALLIATTAAQNGAPAQLVAETMRGIQAGEIDTAEATARLGSFLRDPADALRLQNQRLQNRKLQLEIDEATGDVTSVNVSSEGIQELAGVAQILGSQFKTKFQLEQFQKTVDQLEAQGDEGALADFILNQAISTVPDGEARKKALNNYRIAQQVTNLESLFNAYQEQGGETGFFRGKTEDIANRFGQVKDPALAQLGTEVLNVLDELARGRTGAVISESEEKLYARLLPGTFKAAELNQATIDGLRNSMIQNVDSVLRFQLTGSGFDSIEPYLDIANMGTRGEQQGIQPQGTFDFGLMSDDQLIEFLSGF